MEDKMAAEAFGHATNYGRDGLFSPYNNSFLNIILP